TFSIAAPDGPLPGAARVEVYSEPVELEQLEAARRENPNRHVALKPVHVPAKFNVRSNLTQEIHSDGEKNVLNLTLTSK
ncbi:MAG: hypothetical protein KF861_19555, partial [Planctomycetaceae bacterium]|nr:hypothetical protein [Planctomycetaceae bacterium]